MSKTELYYNRDDFKFSRGLLLLTRNKFTCPVYSSMYSSA